MSDQRYSLEHVGRRGAGETRGGLSLVVRDDWSGESRDPATLSGGETFVVSLALALGLADVVAHEAGGADLATLFVDEGFGSLDAETLDDVLDILDTLRENGRAVGVVSHVAEMRDRIPTQLVVTKARTGSTLRSRRLTALGSGACLVSIPDSPRSPTAPSATPPCSAPGSSVRAMPTSGSSGCDGRTSGSATVRSREPPTTSGPRASPCG